MTLKVTIKHDMPGYDMSAKVEQQHRLPDGTLETKHPVHTKVIGPGQEESFYIHSSNELHVTEVPNVVKDEPTTT